jgi:hypothetical protein
LVADGKIFYEPFQSVSGANSHLNCKAGFVEGFDWSEILESLEGTIVEPLRHVRKCAVWDVAEVSLLQKELTQQAVRVFIRRSFVR